VSSFCYVYCHGADLVCNLIMTPVIVRVCNQVKMTAWMETCSGICHKSRMVTRQYHLHVMTVVQVHEDAVAHVAEGGDI
jgi:hypothetical protein